MPGPVLQLGVKNLRNSQLSAFNIDSMSDSVLSLYHSLITGSKDFPMIGYGGTMNYNKVSSPFPVPRHVENTEPSPWTVGPAGMIVPPAGSTSSPPTMLTPPLPERANIYALRADPRNCVRQMEYEGITFTRVISTVYWSESTEMNNRWRVTDYSANGHVKMSVLCQFIRESACYAKKPLRRKRMARDEETTTSSSQSRPNKRLM